MRFEEEERLIEKLESSKKDVWIQKAHLYELMKEIQTLEEEMNPIILKINEKTKHLKKEEEKLKVLIKQEHEDEDELINFQERFEKEQGID